MMFQAKHPKGGSSLKNIPPSPASKKHLDAMYANLGGTFGIASNVSQQTGDPTTIATQNAGQGTEGQAVHVSIDSQQSYLQCSHAGYI